MASCAAQVCRPPAHGRRVTICWRSVECSTTPWNCGGNSILNSHGSNHPNRSAACAGASTGKGVLFSGTASTCRQTRPTADRRPAGCNEQEAAGRSVIQVALLTRDARWSWPGATAPPRRTGATGRCPSTVCVGPEYACAHELLRDDLRFSRLLTSGDPNGIDAGPTRRPATGDTGGLVRRRPICPPRRASRQR